MATRITVRKPDDWHLHVRDRVVPKAVRPCTATRCGRAILMPNLTLPVTTFNWVESGGYELTAAAARTTLPRRLRGSRLTVHASGDAAR